MDAMDLTYKANIPGEVWEWGIDNAGSTSRYVNFLEYREGELVMRIFAIQHKKHDVLRATEVIRRATGTDNQVVKNFTHSLYCRAPVYQSEDKYGTYGFMIFKASEFDEWKIDDTKIGVTSFFTNLDALFEIDEFKYCGYSGGMDIIKYLNEYRKNHAVEMFGKLGIPPSSSLMRRAEKDRQFRRFLVDNACDISMFGPKAAIYAYEHGTTVSAARSITYDHQRRCMKLAYAVPEVKGTKIDREKLVEYLRRSEHSAAIYNDYLMAIKFLKLDLTDTKNTFPRDLQRMHDLRCAEYESQKVSLEKESNDKFICEFRKASHRLKCFEFRGDDYSVIIPEVPEELRLEGNALQHCVGRMGYDVKMAQGKTFIAFIRRSENPCEPFVTAEVDCKTLTLRQCYGIRDSRPDDNVTAFVNAWVEWVKRGDKARKVKVG